MARFFINLAYLGRNFHGWQRQPNAPSVQEALEKALGTLMQQPVAVTGAGRTDAGVNASMMYAHFDLPNSNLQHDELQRIARQINAITGPDIAIRNIIAVHPNAHARFDATKRTYRYWTHVGRNPFACGLSWHAPDNLNFESMNHAAELLLQTTDFTSFAKLHTDTKTNICHVTHAQWHTIADTTPGDIIPGAATHYFEITADRFLRNMVRAVVGTLVDVGRGKISRSQFADIIETRDRCAAGTSMPGTPLFLYDVQYPYIDNNTLEYIPGKYP